MALGWCRTCDHLHTIKERPVLRPATDPRPPWDWVPVDHDGPDGKPCPGSKRAI